MGLPIITIAVAFVLVAMGCSPELNWRQIDVAQTPLQALFPCQPERASRRLVLAGREVELVMSGCSAGSTTLGVGQTTLADPTSAATVVEQWQRATLATMGAKNAQQSVFKLVNPQPRVEGIMVKASGIGPDAQPMELQAAWFVHGPNVFVAMIYGRQLPADVTDMFFTGLRLR